MVGCVLDVGVSFIDCGDAFHYGSWCGNNSWCGNINVEYVDCHRIL